MKKNSTERKAIEIVKKFEQERTNEIPEEMPNGHGYDIKSGNRFIEVKGTYGGLDKVWVVLHHTFFKKMWNSGRNYYIYFVYNLNDKPKMKIINPEKIFPNLEIEPKYILRGKIIRDKEIDEIDVSKFYTDSSEI
ncbi:MAG: DUF3883 domain-containing protein [Candidatus Aenigmarchaeota archaeon]|nr:DUF3883 domain-containing protein [Candidatus Aenigmarchaeota archaeon]